MKKIIYVGLVCMLTFNAHAINDLHFFRAQPFFGEPRFEKPWLSSFDITTGLGATEHARTGCNGKTCLLNIYGPHAMQQLGQGVPKGTTDPIDIILTNLAQLPAQNGFGNLIYTGRFSVVEATFSYIQNFTRGFFAGVFLPFYSLRINNVCFTDCSPCDQSCPNINTPVWQAFLNAYETILNKYDLYVGPIKKRGISDTVVYVGWTTNYQETEVIDYIDFTLKLGGLIPTGERKNENSAFDLAVGYNGHPGIIISGTGSVGTYDWLTIGTHMEALMFFPKCYDIRMKTDINQSGFIKLARGKAEINKGAVWRIGAYTRADHLARGLSCLVGYSYSRQNSDSIAPCDTYLFNPSIVNSDEMFKGWYMHTIHFTADYDFTKETMRVGPRLGVYYDVQLAGQRTFNANMGGGTFGFDVAVDF